MTIHLTYTFMMTLCKLEKTLPSDINDEQIVSQRGRAQYQMSRTVSTAPWITKFTFTKHNDSLCIDQLPFPDCSSIISLELLRVMCFLSVCQTSAVRSTQSPTQSQRAIRDIILRTLPVWDLSAEKALKTRQNSLNLDPQQYYRRN